MVRDLIEYVARGLADEPDFVRVEVRAPGQGRGEAGPGLTVYELSVAPADLGKVIGRQGRTAKALRTLVTAAAEARGEKATLEILD